MTEHVHERIQDYVDGELSEPETRRVEAHLAVCEECRRAERELASLVEQIGTLSARVEPGRDLWEDIAARIVATESGERSATSTGITDTGEHIAAPADPGDRTHATTDAEESVAALSRRFRSNGRVRNADARPASGRDSARRRLRRVGWSAAAAVAVVVTAVLFLGRGPGGEGGWEVESLAGLPLVGEQALHASGVLRRGQWLVTDAVSRARMQVSVIGEVEVEPNSRVQLRGSNISEHRIALDRGRIEARIFAPPRLFIVETPSATAIDLGCVYTLVVDSSGVSTLHVTSGYVELVRSDRSSIVPAGAMAVADPVEGLGTAFSADASPAFRAALRRYDFEGSETAELDVLLDESRKEDAITLWQLIERESLERRRAIYDRLTALVHPPAGATLQGVLEGDEEVYHVWRMHLGLEPGTWWDYLLRKISPKS